MMLDLTALGPYALVILAGLFAHACFQLSIGMLSVMHSHVIGAGQRHSVVLQMSIGYIAGALISTAGLLAIATSGFMALVPERPNSVAWIVVAALAIVIGWLTLLFYYRRGKGTQLWLPRKITHIISTRAKQSTRSFESFSLGLATVIIELPFLIAPLMLAGAVLSTLEPTERTIGFLAYTLAANSPLLVITALVGGGHTISSIQRWRESNKQFLQWTSGLTLILLGVYLFVIKIWGQTT